MPQLQNTLKAKLKAINWLMVLALLGFAAVLHWALHEVQAGTRAVSELSAAQPAEAALTEAHLLAFQILDAARRGDSGGMLGSLESRLREQRAQARNLPETGGREQPAEAGRLADAYYAALEDDFLPKVRHGDVAAAQAVMSGALSTLYARYQAAIDGVAQAVQRDRQQAETLAHARALYIEAGLILLWAALVLASWVLLDRWTMRPALKRLDNVRETLGRMGEGRYDNVVEAGGDDELGRVIDAVGHLQIRLRETVQALSTERQSAQRYLDVAGVMLLVLRPDGRIKQINRAGSLIVGLEPHELSDKNWFDTCVPVETRDEARSRFQQIIAAQSSPDPISIEGTVLTPRGERRLLSWTGVRMFDADGRLEGVIFSGEDITARRELESQLLQATLDAQSASRAKSEFLASMSHEIRTPLNGIIGLTGLVLRTALNDQQRDYLGQVQTQSQTLLALINDIVDYAKIEAGKLELEVVPFDLDNVLGRVLGQQEERAAAKGLEIVLDRDPALEPVWLGDPVRLEQVLGNLVSNAVKFTDSGEVVITVRPEPGAAAGRAPLRFEVRDTGVGIAPGHIGKLFSAFNQAEGIEVRQHGGTGLGLAISRRLVELMGGSMQVSSEIKKGSVFSFGIPLQRSTTTLADQRVRMDELAGMRVLLIDDNPTALHVGSKVLESFGMQVTTAASGFEGLRIWRDAMAAQRPFSVVFVDWSMPHVDGGQVIEAMREQDPEGRTVFIMVTAHERAVMQDAASRARPDGWVRKPTSPSTLLDSIATALHGGQALGVAPPRASPLHQTWAEGVRVLVVEDNIINQQVAIEFLSLTGAEITVASNGPEALRKLGEQMFDLVFTDVQMPGMDGYELTRKIREQESLRHLPIVAVTANAMRGDRERCLQAGMDDYISKPLVSDALYACLARWARRDAAHGGATDSAAPGPNAA